MSLAVVAEGVADDGVLVQVHLPEDLHQTVCEGLHVGARVTVELARRWSSVPHANAPTRETCSLP